MPKLEQRSDTAANWTSNNPILGIGEIGFETDTGKFKIGNSTGTWIALTYAGGGGSVAIVETTQAAFDALTTEQKAANLYSITDAGPITLTQAEYSALTTPDPNRIYHIIDVTDEMVVVAAAQWHLNPLQDSGPTNGGLILINRAYVCAWYTPVAVSLSDLAVNVITAGTAGNVMRFGVYARNTAGMPGTLLGQGTVAVDTTGIKTLTFGTPLVVESGVFWIVAVEQGSGTLSVIYTQMFDHKHVPLGTSAPLGNNAASSVTWYFSQSGSFISDPGLTRDDGVAAGRVPFLSVKYSVVGS